MDGQSVVEPRRQEHQMDLEREPAEDEWKSWQRGQLRRNTLHLVSAAAQWILLFACLIYLGIDALQLSTSQSDEVPWTYIQYTGESVEGTAMNLSAETGSIHIRNGSLMITCDGLYLVSLKGLISFPDLERNDSLKLILGKKDNKTSKTLWEQTLEDNGKTVDLITMLYLFAQDNVALWTNTNATVKGLSFSLVLLSPIFYCLL
ncbi:tumor necrosis factor ligand superfamily member 4 [Dromaius novaehollandiae]|uniref:tumor necrosis factor ligand superfamily member 4 n=1 Tax=Dromaius novaehollandiae TaxID=8790 RepID=UPI00311D539C